LPLLGFQVGKKNLALSGFLSIRMFSTHCKPSLPLFVIFRFVGLVDSYAGLVLCYNRFQSSGSRSGILKGFIEELPREIEEAAKVDGGHPLPDFSKYRRLPLNRPRFGRGWRCSPSIFAWNDFAYAVIFSGSNVYPPAYLW